MKFTGILINIHIRNQLDHKCDRSAMKNQNPSSVSKNEESSSEIKVNEIEIMYVIYMLLLLLL